MLGGLLCNQSRKRREVEYLMDHLAGGSVGWGIIT